MQLNQTRRVLIGIGGGIAAYKAVGVISTLVKEGVEVRAVLTEAAQAFVTPLTVATLCRHPAYTDADFWQPTHARPLHIALGEWAEVLVLAPLTANSLAKLALGLADNLLTNTVLASTAPLLLAPAMNTDMWWQPSVQRNWQRLQQDPRSHWVGPGAGRLACDRTGPGRLAEPAQILAHIRSLLHTQGDRDLSGQRVVINTGSTREYLDAVRFIGNPASGKMGIALAQAAYHRGAQVTLIHGSVAAELLQPLEGIETIAVTDAEAMQQAMVTVLPQADWIFLAAAVADVKPAQSFPEKLPKAKLPEALPLLPVPDIAADLARRKQPHQRLIGFAAQTGQVVPAAMAKLQAKGLDAIVANPIDQPTGGFGSDWNQAVVLDRHGGQQAMALCPKLELAHHLFDHLIHRLAT
ncbi:Coenzyme A biosynthesis bifunctional protein CoaBC [Halomicronema hongdechloris C2206]|uniref:Coenzyme A biosynthesis bifunctional protein CoaBC n=1 Tax=Halomicronema hongdechloris C2206 TaxID=1641165 RepID=A0A1Z3HKN1_9CYAN|nr:Coenzyme A biosynthesis bifunctional protein CoaBC [Halomicronema hongdechloris C2206]